ncbi:DinB family protein [Actinocorallia herbida]|uniref:DinB family protein n=1 Tax=Actinocorallia herbida TaxID=58109 RepID=A0A3N1CUK5_9ACTN|nr:DinB family protein [Actinocorallia herbida]ROO84915.1 DinB family protein [Actinocorallia herbida]
MDAHDFSWNRTLREQWEQHYQYQLRARLQDLTDEEYFWSPVAGPWTVRPRAAAGEPAPGPDAHGVGDFLVDFTYPMPEPAPFTTIAWRLGHVIVGVLAVRNAAHFGGPPASYESWEYAGDAATALTQLETQLDRWLAGVASLGEDGLRAPIGPAEPFPDAPTAALVLHIHRELIHHLSEVCLLRDLYLHRSGASR